MDLAIKNEPQAITLRGEAVTVIVTFDEFKAMTRPKETVAEFFSPFRHSGIQLKRFQ